MAAVDVMRGESSSSWCTDGVATDGSGDQCTGGFAIVVGDVGRTTSMEGILAVLLGEVALSVCPPVDLCASMAWGAALRSFMKREAALSACTPSAKQRRCTNLECVATLAHHRSAAKTKGANAA
jgi:hypothetical protein